MQITIKGKKIPNTLVGVSAAWCILSTVFICLWPAVFDGVNWGIYDWKMSLVARPLPSRDIVHVDVDDTALARLPYGQWPWSREVSGRIVRRLAELGARVIAFDVLYTAAGRVPEEDEFFFGSMQRAGNVVSATGLNITPPRDKMPQWAGDRNRIDALYDKSWTLAAPVVLDLRRVWRLDDSVVPLKPIIEMSREVGHIKSTPDRDGVHRRVPLFVRWEDRVVPSLAMAMVAAAGYVQPPHISLDASRAIRMRLDAREITVPVNSRGMMLINWGKPWESFPHHSVTDVLSDAPDSTRAGRYKDKIVIVAVTATGTTDIGPTPLDAECPLSRVHSNALATILTGAFIHAIEPFPIPVGVAGLLAILFSAGAAVLPLRRAIIAFAAIGGLSLIIPALCFAFLSWEIPMAEFFTIFVPAAAFSLVSMAVTKESVAARTSSALKRYLSPEVVEKVISAREEWDLSTKRKELTVMFVDIEGFSTISETVDVEYLTGFLNEFFELMTRVVFNRHGTVDKFLGDGLLAFFGDPVIMENHALVAVNAAIDMQREMAGLSSRWAQKGIPEFQKGVKIRIGVSTGIVVVGNIGSTRRMEYTVVGSEINVASRIQSKAPSGGIMITARTHALTRHALRCVGPEIVKVKGMDRPVEVYVVDPSLVQEAPES